MKMRKTPRHENVQLRLSADLMDWIHEFRGAMKVVPSRSEAIRYLIERGITIEEAEAREHLGKPARKAADGQEPPSLSEHGARQDGPSRAAGEARSGKPGARAPHTID
jgi:hypothetical protein